MKTMTLGQWTLQPELNIIKSETDSLQLEPLTMKMLVFMTGKLGEAITRKELMDHIWGSTVVSNDSLNRIASQLRKIFDQDNDIQLDTIRGIGYRLSVVSDLSAKQTEHTKGNRKKWAFAIAGIAAISLLAFLWLRPSGAVSENKKTELETLTQLPGFLLNPAISPNDKLMAFSWNGGEGTKFNIYLKEEGSPTPTQFSDNGFDLGPEWSPLGDFIAFNSFSFKDQSSILKIKSLIGSTTRGVENIGTLNGISPIHWSPDGQYIVISTVPKGERRSQLNLVDPEKLTLTPLTKKQDDVSDVMPRFSPDGKQVIFVRTDGKLNDLSPNQDRTNDVILVDPLTGVESSVLQDLPNLFGIEWLDQETIIYSTRHNHRSAINSYSLKSKDRKVIFSSPNIRLQGLDLFHKNRKLVVEAQRFDNNIQILGLTDTSAYSKEQVVQFTSSDFYPALNSKKQLAYVSDYSGLEQIWLIEKEGDAPKQLTYFKEANNISNPEWSPTGDQIIFSIRPPVGNMRIEKIETNGTNHMVLRKGNANYGSPTWSTDQSSVYFYSDSLQKLALFKMDLESRKTQQVVKGSAIMAKETEKGVFYVKFDEAGIWFQNEDKQEELIVENLTFISMADWDISGDMLVYLSPVGNNTDYVLFDLNKREEVKRIRLPRMKRPIPSLGVAFNLAENEIYITSSTEFISALNTLSW